MNVGKRPWTRALNYWKFTDRDEQSRTGGREIRRRMAGVVPLEQSQRRDDGVSPDESAKPGGMLTGMNTSACPSQPVSSTPSEVYGGGDDPRNPTLSVDHCSDWQVNDTPNPHRTAERLHPPTRGSTTQSRVNAQSVPRSQTCSPAGVQPRKASARHETAGFAEESSARTAWSMLSSHTVIEPQCRATTFQAKECRGVSETNTASRATIATRATKRLCVAIHRRATVRMGQSLPQAAPAQGVLRCGTVRPHRKAKFAKCSGAYPREGRLV